MTSLWAAFRLGRTSARCEVSGLRPSPAPADRPQPTKEGHHDDHHRTPARHDAGTGTRAPRPWWKKPLTWIIAGIAFVALGGTGLAAYAAVSGTTTAAPQPAATATAKTTQPASPAPTAAAPTPTPAVTVTVTAPPPAAVPAPAAPALTNAVAGVQQFYQDITNHNYPAAWALGGKNLDNGVGYDRWVAGYATTASIDLTTYGQWSNGTVYASLSALQTDGTVKTYYGTYTVSGGQIVAAHIKQTG